MHITLDSVIQSFIDTYMTIVNCTFY